MVTPIKSSIRSSHQNFVDALVLILLLLTSSATEVKILDIKVGEICAILYCFYAMIRAFMGKSFMNVNKSLFLLFGSLVLWCMMLLTIAVFTTEQFQYQPLNDLPLLRQPILISISRAVQLLICTSVMVLIASYVRESNERLKQIVTFYSLIGILSAIYGLLSFSLLKFLNLDIGGAYITVGGAVRARSLFAEGGPWGLYLVSVLLIAHFWLAQQRANALVKVSVYALIIAALLSSASKAAVLALVILIMISQGISRHTEERKSRLFSWTLSLVWILLLMTTGYFLGIENYIFDYSNVLFEGVVESGSTSLVMGRIAGMVIVPNMILTNPFTGIGLGNYPLLRNNPEYRGHIPFVDDWDLDGLGLFGFIAEVGIPLVLILMVLLSLAPLRIRNMTNLSYYKDFLALSLFPILAFIFGVQVTFIYPWIIMGIVMAITINPKINH